VWFSVDDREDSAARPARLFHFAGTFQPPSTATDMNGNRDDAHHCRKPQLCAAVPKEAERSGVKA
jgi:hypothetical protein